MVQKQSHVPKSTPRSTLALRKNLNPNGLFLPFLEPNINFQTTETTDSKIATDSDLRMYIMIRPAIMLQTAHWVITPPCRGLAEMPDRKI